MYLLEAIRRVGATVRSLDVCLLLQVLFSPLLTCQVVDLKPSDQSYN